MTHRYRSFLASSWNSPELRALRKSIWNRYQNDQRGRVWVAEGVRPDLDPKSGVDQLEIIDACLDAIEAANEFVLLDTGEYGSQLHSEGGLSESSFIELELFQAALLAKPIRYIFVGRPQPNSPLYQLVKSLGPHISVTLVSSLREAEAEISNHLEGQHYFQASTSTVVSRRLSGTLVKSRHNDWSNQNLFHEPQFLHGAVCGPIQSKTDLDVAEHFLELAGQQSQTNRVLTRTWIAMRSLMASHYSETNDSRALALWDKALRTWSKAAAWRGLHGHLWLGNVAALGSIARMRERLNKPFFDSSTPEQGDLYDSLASVYYSISKHVPSTLTAPMLDRSTAYVGQGLATRSREQRLSLLPIRGSINQRQHRFRASAKDFAEALELATKQDADAGQIGFLLTELGFAELFLLKPRVGRKRLEEGLALMTEENSSPGFRVRALRKHMSASLVCLDLGGAKASATQAYKIAQQHQLHDQIDPLLRKLTQKDH